MPRPHVALLAALCALTFFVGLGRPAITDSDEAYYAEAAREMVERSDWVTPHYNGQFRFEKPVLYYWLAALAYLAAGVGEGAARFPSACAGLVLVLTTFACARRWYDPATALLAGAITATSFGYVAAAHQAVPDLLLACFITLGTWTAHEALIGRRPAGPAGARRWWLLASGAALAGAFLTKGPVGVVLPLAVVGPLAIWQVWADRGRVSPGPALGRLAGDVALLVAVSLLLTAPWFAAMTSVHGVAYLDRFFIGENLQRFATDRYNAPRPLWYYLPIVAGGLLPWSPLLLLWCRPLLRVVRRMRRIQTVEVWLAVWACAPILFYSISIGKQPRYILPVLPPLAILLARTMVNRLWPADGVTGATRQRVVAVAGVLSGAVVVALGLFVYRAQDLFAGVSSTSVALAVSGIVASGGAVIVVALSRGQHRLPHAIVAAAIVSTLTAQYVVLSRPGSEPVEEMAALVRAAGPPDLPYGRYGVFVRNLVFYTGRPHVEVSSVDQMMTFMRSTDPVLGVVVEAHLEQMLDAGLDLHELGRVSYLNTGNLNFRTLLRPDPDTQLQTVVLVGNRPSRDSDTSAGSVAP